MLKYRALACVGITIILGSSTVSCKSTTKVDDEGILGQYPLCEASAALIQTCPDGIGDCLIVGDNEQKNDLFLFKLKDGALDSNSQQTLNLKLSDENALSDIEAMAPISAHSILVLGSHSRNSKCEAKKKRRRFAEVKLSSQGAEVVRQIPSRKIKCKRLLGQFPPESTVLNAVCDTIDRVEKEAKNLENQQLTDEIAKNRCNEIVPFNAEGAVAIPTEKGIEFWVGLRAPLLPEYPGQPQRKKLAMLLRLIDLETYKFDRVALLDLGARGIRDLTFADDRVWLIAGPAEDKSVPFELRSFPKNALQSAEVIEPELLMNLPNSSEGLAIKDGRAYMVTDGDTGKDESSKQCKKPSKFKIVALP